VGLLSEKEGRVLDERLFGFWIGQPVPIVIDPDQGDDASVFQGELHPDVIQSLDGE
jgi:hypothetical protein